MKKTDMIKEAITKDRKEEAAKKTQDGFYSEFNDQDEIILSPEEQLSCDIASHLAMLTAARLDEALLGTNPMVAKFLTKKLEESDAEEMISMLHAIFLTSGMINASEDLDALRFCEKYDNAIYMHFQDELTDADPQSDLTSSLGWNGDEIEKSIDRLMYLATQEYRPIVHDSIIHHPERVDLIPSNLDLSSMETQPVNAMSREKILSNLLKTVKNDYDYILIDCMPSLGMLTINALTAADSVNIPFQAQFLPEKGMTQLMKSIEMIRNHHCGANSMAG